MAKVLVIPGQPTTTAANQLAQRVVACGCDLVLSDHSNPPPRTELIAAVDACDAILVAITGPLLPENIVEALEAGARAGKRLCGIWATEVQRGVAPQILEDLADAILSWNSQKFCAAVCHGEPIWEDAGGDERPTPQNAHHRCK